MNREVKLWIHDGRLYMTPHWITEKGIPDGIKYWGDSVKEFAKEKNKKHCVYATKEVDKTGHTVEVNYYAVCLDDDDFFKRTDAVYEDAKSRGNNIMIYAFHKGTNY